MLDKDRFSSTIKAKEFHFICVPLVRRKIGLKLFLTYVHTERKWHAPVLKTKFKSEFT